MEFYGPTSNEVQLTVEVSTKTDSPPTVVELQCRQPAKHIALPCTVLARKTAQSVLPGATREPVNQYLSIETPDQA